MYEEYYGLSGRPFQLTPDPDNWFDSATHRKAMAYLGYGLAQGEGFIVITGEVGAGKTTLVGHLLATIDRQRLHVVSLVSTQIAATDLLRLTAAALGGASEGLDKAGLLSEIERALHAVARSGRRALLVVDEAQSLSTEAVEELRMLSNFTAGGQALLQIVLLGQPEFRDKLTAEGGLEQLRQRVIATHHLEAMEAEEVEGYVVHRLNHAGWTGRPRFTPDGCAALYRASGGIPRVINQIASRALLHGAVEGLDDIGAEAIEDVVADQAGDMAAPVAKAAAAVPSGTERVLNARLERRVAELEAQLEEQGEALRRVLQLLVDWVESDSQAQPPQRDHEAAA